MTTPTISSKAFQLAVRIFNFEPMSIVGSLLSDHHPVEGRILAESGFLNEGEIRSWVRNRHSYDDDTVEPEWNEETRTYQYYSITDGYYVDVPEEDMKTYNLDADRLVRHSHDLTGLDGEPRGLRGNLLWNLGTFWLGKRRAIVFLARHLDQIECFDEIYDTLKRLGSKTPGVVLSWWLPLGRHVELPHGYRMVSMKEALIVEGNTYRLDMEMVKGVLTGAGQVVDDLSPVWSSPDYSTVRVNGKEFVFTGMKQKQVVGFLVEAWKRGEAKCRTQVVLEEVESSADAIGQLFRGRPDWRDLIGQGGGFCWLQV